MLPFVIFFYLHRLFTLSKCNNELTVIDSLTFNVNDSLYEQSDAKVKYKAKRYPRHEKLELKTEDGSQNPTDRQCPGVVCFVKKIDNTSIFDCRSSIIHSEYLILNYVDCTYWQKPQAIKKKRIRKSNRQNYTETKNYAGIDYMEDTLEPIRIRLRPRSMNKQHRVSAQKAEPGALARLCNEIRTNLDLDVNLPLGISLMMLRIDKLNSSDLSDIFIDANVNNLVLWNPIEITETSFLPPVEKFKKYENFVRINLHCEPENVKPAFSRLWIPWVRWSINFRHCEGQYTCYPWPKSSRLCCEEGHCSKNPLYVITSERTELSENVRIDSNLRDEQIVSYSSCEFEPKLSGPLADLEFINHCWSPKKEFDHDIFYVSNESSTEVDTRTNSFEPESTLKTYPESNSTIVEKYDIIFANNSPSMPVFQEESSSKFSFNMATQFSTYHISNTTAGDNENSLFSDTSSSPFQIQKETSPFSESNINTHNSSKLTIVGTFGEHLVEKDYSKTESNMNENGQLTLLTACVISLLILNVFIFIGMLLLFCWMSNKWKRRKLEEGCCNWQDSYFQNNIDSNRGSSIMSRVQASPDDDGQNGASYSSECANECEILTGSRKRVLSTLEHVRFCDRIWRNRKLACTFKKAFRLKGHRYSKQHTLVMDAKIDPQWLEPNLHPI